MKYSFNANEVEDATDSDDETQSTEGDCKCRYSFVILLLHGCFIDTKFNCHLLASFALDVSVYFCSGSKYDPILPLHVRCILCCSWNSSQDM